MSANSPMFPDSTPLSAIRCPGCRDMVRRHRTHQQDQGDRMPTIMQELHKQQKPLYMWKWDEGIVLVRDLYPTVAMERLFDTEASVGLYSANGRFGRGYGHAEFAFLLDSEQCVMGIAETRDFEEGEHEIPLWGNARVVPRSLDLYDQIQTILTTIRS